MRLDYRKSKKGVSVAIAKQNEKLIDRLNNADKNNDITTPSSSDTSDEVVTPNNKDVLGARINIVIDETDENVVSINNDEDIDNALSDTSNTNNRVSTPDLLLDPSGNTN